MNPEKLAELAESFRLASEARRDAGKAFDRLRNVTTEAEYALGEAMNQEDAARRALLNHAAGVDAK